MKDLLSNEHYSYKIHTLLMNRSAYPSSIDNLIHFYKKILISTSIFQKSHPL